MGKKYSGKDKKVSSKHHKRKKKNSGSSSSSSSSFSSASLSSLDEETKSKLKKKFKKLQKKKKKKKRDKKALKKLMKGKAKDEVLSLAKKSQVSNLSSTVAVEDPTLIEKSKSLAPMTKEEWEKQQNTLKRVFDEETGRMRLVKGSGEIVEECVRRERHLAINKQATRGDGEYFQRKLGQMK